MGISRLVRLCLVGLISCTVLRGAPIVLFEDHFNGPVLGSDWIEEDGYEFSFPFDTNNFATYEMTGTHLRISIPPGAEHNQFNLHHAGVVHRNFMGSGTYEAKMDTVMQAYRQFGLIFQNTNAETSMAFLLYSDGTDLRAFVERFSLVDGVVHKTTVAGTPLGYTVPVTGPFHLRGTVFDHPDPTQRRWVFEWSRDGVGWTKIFDAIYEGSEPNENIGLIKQVGAFVGEHAEYYGGPEQLFSVEIDYFKLIFPDVSAVHTRAKNSRIELFWDSVAIADSYQVFQSTQPNSGFSLVGTTAVPSFAQDGLQNDVRYYYYVVPLRGAQVGGASAIVSAVPHPTVIDAVPANGLVLALAADELVYNYSDGQPVTEWASAAGEQIAASGMGPSAPTFVSSGLNGVPTVRFDGVDDFLALPDGFQDFTGGMTLFVVMRPTALQTHFKTLLLGGSSFAQSIGLGRGLVNGWMFFTANQSGAVDWFEALPGPVAGEASVVSVLMEPGAPNSTQPAAVAKNSALLQYADVYVPPVVNRTQNYIGKGYANDGKLQGDISEVLLYNRLLTQAERSDVHNYLQQKYGLGAPAPVFPPPLGVPGNVLAAPADGTVALTWSSVLRAVGYRVYRREGANTVPTLVADITGTAYTDDSVVNGRTYHYAIEAYTGSETATSPEVPALPLAPPPLPSGIPVDGLILALDATTISEQVTPGQLLTSWPDASPLRNNAFAAAGTNAPLLVADAVGGKPALRFDGVDDFLTLPAGFQDFTAGMSLYVVMRPTGPPTYWKLLALGNPGGAQGIGLGRSTTTPGLLYYTANQAGIFDWYSTSGGITLGEASLVACFQESGVPNGVSYSGIHQNQNSLSVDEVFVPPVLNRTANYIAKSPWNDGNFGGDIAEILLYDRLLSDGERTTVQNYFSQKYGFSAATAAFPPPLSAPQNVSAAAGDGIVQLNWSPVLRATGYRVFRRSTPAGTFSQIADISGTNHTDTAVINGQSYTYIVRAHREPEVSPESAPADAIPLAVPSVPAGIPTDGLLLCLDAEGIAQQLSSGQAVHTWLDASPARNDAVAVGLGAPVLIHGAIGSRAAFRFDGIDDYLRLPAGFSDFTAGMSIFVVHRPAAINNNMKIFVFGNSGGFDSFGLSSSGASTDLLHFTANGANFDWFTTSEGPVVGEASLLSVLQEPGPPGSESYAAVFQNGSFLGGDSVYVPQAVSRSQNFIAHTYWNDGKFQGDISEVIVYNRLLSSTERGAVHDYFQQKYGFGGPSGTFPPALSAPGNLVAGAGDATVSLSWSSVPQVTGYRVYRREGVGGSPSQIATISGLSYNDTGVLNGQTYTYSVRAFNASQESADSALSSATPMAPPEPPAGVPVNGLILSLNASSLTGTITNGQGVSVWKDASPLRKNAVAPGGTPIFVQDGIGGKPSVRFDGIDDYLTLPSGFENFVNGFSLYMVVKPSAAHLYTKLLLLGTGSDANSIGLSRAGLAEGLLFHTGNSAGGVEWFQTGSGLPTGDTSALSVLLEPGPENSLRFAELSRNGSVLHQEEVFVPAVVTRNLNYIGNSYWNDGPFQGDIAEVLLYNRLLTPAEEAAIHSYFSQEYGISFP